jgi:hypothetical protein
MYQPPPRLALLFADPKTKARIKGFNNHLDKLMSSAISPTSASVPGGWNSLLALATGIHQEFPNAPNLQQISDHNGAAATKMAISSVPSEAAQSKHVKRASNFKYSTSLVRTSPVDITGDPETDGGHVVAEIPTQEDESGSSQGRGPDSAAVEVADDDVVEVDLICVSDYGHWKKRNGVAVGKVSDEVKVEYGALHSLVQGKKGESQSKEAGDASTSVIFEENGQLAKSKFGLYVRPSWKRNDPKSLSQTSEQPEIRYVDPFQPVDIQELGLVDIAPKEKKVSTARKSSKKKLDPEGTPSSSQVMFGLGADDAGHDIEFAAAAEEPQLTQKAAASAKKSKKKVSESSDQPSADKPKRRSSRITEEAAASDSANLAKRRSKKATAKAKAKELIAPAVDGMSTPPRILHSEDSNFFIDNNLFSPTNENSVMFASNMLYLPHMEASNQGHEHDQDSRYYLNNPEQGSLSGFEDGATSFFGGATFLDMDFSNHGHTTHM